MLEQSNFPLLITFAFYLSALLWIGVVAYQRTNSEADYLLAGRRLGPLSSALSAGASDMSGWLLLGLPGFAYVAGLEALWLGLGLLIGTWCNWRWVAAPLRRESEKENNALTLPSYFASRYGDEHSLIRILSAVFILTFFLFYTSSGLIAGAKLFESVFSIGFESAVLIGALAVVSYTFFGGFLAVVWTDVLQGLLMLLALMVLPLVVIHTLGGMPATLARIEAHNPAMLSVLTNIRGQPLGWIAIVSSLAWGLGYFGQPHILARFMAIQHSRRVARARRIAVIWTALSLCGALAVGLAGAAFLNQTLQDTETIFIVLAQALLNPWLAGVLLAAILAAIMSTADSQLLVSSSVLAEDLYRAKLRPQASDGELLWVGRLSVVFIAAIAVLIALTGERSILTLVSYAWAGFGAVFGPVVLMSLYWTGLNSRGVIAAMLTGGLTVIFWSSQTGGLFELYELIPGFLLATIAAVLVSKLTNTD